MISIERSFYSAFPRLAEGRGRVVSRPVVDLLRRAGVEVWEADEHGRQFRVSAVGGHFGGSLDGAARGLVEAPEKLHVLEFKTSGDKPFRDLVKNGVEKSKPEHFAQMQAYMHLMGIDHRKFSFKFQGLDQRLTGVEDHHVVKGVLA